MSYRTILSLDPSGNFNEGRGTTGWCIMNTIDTTIIDAGSISAKYFKSMEEYWNAHIILIDNFINKFPDNAVLIEDYILYEHKAENQINSRMETPKLIGVIQYFCWEYNIPLYFQRACDVKSRWSNSILIHKNIIEETTKGFELVQSPEIKITRHTIDAIRHAMHFSCFKNGR